MITRDQLVPLIKAHRKQSLGSDDGDLSNQRAEALDHYHGRPYGDEQEGRSQVVSRDLSETLDWVVPAIIKILMQSGSLVNFTPVGEDDEEKAEQESEMVNHAILKDNNGFLVIHDAIKDCLLLKNGYIKHYWDTSEIVREREYQNLTDEQMVMLYNELEETGAEVEILEKETTERQEQDQETGEDIIVDSNTYLKIRTTTKVNKVRLEAVPPEEVRVSKSCRGSLQESPFVEHETTKTRTGLIEMGMPEDFVRGLPSINDRQDQETTARDSVSDETDGITGLTVDRSMDEIKYTEAYIWVDLEDSGKAQLRKIVTVADRIPPGDEWIEVIDCVPMTQLVSKRIPHRHVGESLDDDLCDLQRIKTVLMRQLVDNTFATNNQQFIVNNRVHLPDFMISLPGGFKRVKDDQPVNGAVEPLITPPILNQLLPTIEYIDSVKQNRTGIDGVTTGVDPDVLKQTTKGAFLQNVTNATQKVEMLARMIAETGIKELAIRVHELLLKNQSSARVIKIRGKYVPVNPEEWKERTDLDISVGLGTGTEEEKRNKLMVIASYQEKLAEFGLISPQNAYNLFREITKTMGFPTPEKYILDPSGPEYKEAMEAQQKAAAEQVNPLAEAEQVKAQAQIQVEQMKAQVNLMLEQAKLKNEQEITTLKAMLQQQQKQAELAQKEAIEIAKLEVQAFLEGFKIDLGKQGIGAELAPGTIEIGSPQGA